MTHRGPKPKPFPTLTPDRRAWVEAETVRLLPWVRSMAHRCPLPIPLDDLIQIGALAVFQALPRFDPSLNVPITTWLYPRVWGSFNDYARQHGRLTTGGARTGRKESVCSLERVAYRDDAGRDVPYRDLIEDAAAEDPGRPDINDVVETVAIGCTDQEQEVLRLLYARGQNQEQAGKTLGLSASRVSQLRTSAFNHLRKNRGESVREACA